MPELRGADHGRCSARPRCCSAGSARRRPLRRQPSRRAGATAAAAMSGIAGRLSSTSASRISFAVPTRACAATFGEYLPLFAGATDVGRSGLRPWRVSGRAASPPASARAASTATKRWSRSPASAGSTRPHGDALGYLDGAARRVARRPHRHAGRRASRAVVPDTVCSTRLSPAASAGAPIVLETINPACWYASSAATSAT